MDNLWCSWCKARAAQMVDEGGAPKCYECEVRLQAGAIQLLRDTLANAQASRDDLRKERDELIANAAAGASEIAKSRQEAREYQAQLCDLRHQIGERDGVIAQLRAKSAEQDLALTELSAELVAIKGSPLTVPAVIERYEVLGRRAALRRKGRLTKVEQQELERLDYVASQLLHKPSPDSELVSKVARMLREAGVESPDLPDGYDVTGLVARLQKREAPQIKPGARVLWRAHNGDLIGTVTRTWDTPDGLACEVAGDTPKHVWTALAWALEVGDDPTE